MSTTARLSLTEYDRMIDRGVFDVRNQRRIELIRGELRQMNPIGSQHEVAVDYLTEWSILNLPRGQVWVRVQNSIGLPALQSAPEPDIVWVARRDFTIGRPSGDDVLLIIEVSESSLRFDRTEKADLYASAEIPDYWIVNLPDRAIEVMREPVDGRYRDQRIFSGDDCVQPRAFPTLSLRVSELFSAHA